MRTRYLPNTAELVAKWADHQKELGTEGVLPAERLPGPLAKHEEEASGENEEGPFQSVYEAAPN